MELKGLLSGQGNYNKTKVYEWYFSMLPKNVDANVKGDLKILLERIITEEKPDNGNGESNGNGY